LAAKPTRELPDQIFSSGKTTGTLVRTGKTFSSEGQILGILAPAGTVSVVKPVEQNDPALIGVVETFVGRMNTNYTWWISTLLNPHFTTRILRLDEGLNAAEISVRYDEEVIDAGEVKVACSHCAEEKVTLLVRNSAIPGVV
jgi:hypothetical protein